MPEDELPAMLGQLSEGELDRPFLFLAQGIGLCSRLRVGQGRAHGTVSLVVEADLAAEVALAV